jgi:hypothetical protein
MKNLCTHNDEVAATYVRGFRTATIFICECGTLLDLDKGALTIEQISELLETERRIMLEVAETRIRDALKEITP